MVRKLFKHEFIAYSRIWFIIQIILMVVALFGRLIQLTNNDSDIYYMVFGLSTMLYIVSIFASLGFVAVFSVVRFYKNFFSNEGYLTFTLPVSPAQHIWVKLLTALSVMAMSIISAFISVGIFTAGENFAQILRGINEGIGEMVAMFGASTPLFLLEMVVFVLVAAGSELLVYYTCIAIGQTARKNRILAAVGVYFAWYLIEQIFAMIFLTTTMLGFWEFLTPVFIFFAEHEVMGAHITILGLTLFTGIIATVFFGITHTVISKKLNLE